VNLAEDNHQILGNKNALTGAIQNLLHNSITALQENRIPQRDKAIVSIQAYSQDNYVYLSIKDNGPGIDKNIAEKIFQPFYTSSSKGTGLGLAVVKSVVAAHQGDVSLIHEADQGAHFVIKLPLLANSEAKTFDKSGES
jgi:two-component system sensor histidine kinase FlrB